MSTEQYNYAVFPPDDDPPVFHRFAAHLPVGRAAPDPVLLNLDSLEPLPLSTFTRRGLTLLEFGSLT